MWSGRPRPECWPRAHAHRRGEASIECPADQRGVAAVGAGVGLFVVGDPVISGPNVAEQTLGTWAQP
jgi:hypothetical protein